MHRSRDIATRILAVLLAAGGAEAAQAAPDPARGKQLFARCQACHAVAAGKVNPLGPTMVGVFGAKAATRPGYAYSAALAKSGLVWNAPTLDRWLARPAATVPGNRMAFAGVPDAGQRADIIAYLATLPRK